MKQNHLAWIICGACFVAALFFAEATQRRSPAVSPKVAIEQVFAAQKAAAAIRQQHWITGGGTEYRAAIAEIDLSHCPPEFQAAWLQYAQDLRHGTFAELAESGVEFGVSAHIGNVKGMAIHGIGLLDTIADAARPQQDMNKCLAIARNYGCQVRAH